MRHIVFTLALLWLAAGAGIAPAGRADTTGMGGTGGTTSGTSLTADDFVTEFFLFEDKKWNSVRDSDLKLYFNRARCECNVPFKIRVNLTTAAKQKVRALMNGKIRLGTGSDSCICASQSACVNNNCTYLGGEQDLGALANNYLEFETTIGTLFGAGVEDKTGACERREKENIYILPDSDDSGPYPDITNASREVELDGQPPPTPTLKSVQGGNEALQLTWDPIPLTSADDLQGYAVFCARGGTLSPFGNDYRGAAKHSSKENLCGTGTTAASLTSAEEGLADTTLVTQALQSMPSVPGTAAPKPIRDLDPGFLCADFLTNTNSARLTGLENGVPYVVGVAAVDLRGNASPIESATLAWPYPTRDFYRSYRAEGGSAEGGFCAIGARGSRGAGWWPLLLAAVAVTLLARRRRR